MELRAEEEPVARYFCNLHPAVAPPCEYHAFGFDQGYIFGIDLVSVPVALDKMPGAVHPLRKRTFFKYCLAIPKAHCAARVSDILLFVQNVITGCSVLASSELFASFPCACVSLLHKFPEHRRIGIRRETIIIYRVVKNIVT